MTDKKLSMIGLCMRAGKLVTGEDASVQAVRSGAAYAVVLDGAASANAIKAVSNACNYYHIPLVYVQENELGYAIGKPGRMCVAVTDPSFAEKIVEIR